VSAPSDRPRGWFWRQSLDFAIGVLAFLVFEGLVVFPLIVALVQRNVFATTEELAAVFVSLSAVALFAGKLTVRWTTARLSLEQRRLDEIAWLEAVTGADWLARKLRSMTLDDYEARNRRLGYTGAILLGVMAVALPLSIVADHFEVGIALALLGAMCRFIAASF